MLMIPIFLKIDADLLAHFKIEFRGLSLEASIETRKRRSASNSEQAAKQIEGDEVVNVKDEDPDIDIDL